jgi:hypothetical protein
MSTHEANSTKYGSQRPFVVEYLPSLSLRWQAYDAKLDPEVIEWTI